jgi:hypothetical protein
MSVGHDRGERAWHASLQGLVFALTGFLGSYTVADPDLWGHVRFGLDTLQAGAVVRTDPYSYLSGGQSWINHEWLSEVLMALAWDRFGAPGLVALKLTVLWGIVGVILSHVRRRHLPLAGAAIVIIMGWWLVLPWTTAFRPQVFTYLGCAVVIGLVARAEDGDYAALWWVVPLMAVWANLHGGFIAGIGLFAIWAVAHVASRAWWYGWRHRAAPYAARSAGLPLLAAIAATAITPYGPHLWAFLQTAVEPRTEIAEWNPIALTSLEGLAHVVILVPAVVGWVGSERPRPAGLVAVFVCCAVAPFVARRHTPLFAIAAMMLAAEHMADVAQRVVTRRFAGRTAVPPTPQFRLAVSASVVLGAALFALASLPHFAAIVTRPWDVPVAPVQWLAKAQVTGNMVTFFDWGEYVIWHLAPGIKVSMDGRRETIYPRTVYDEDQQFLFGLGRWDVLLARGNPSLILMSRNFAADNLIRQSPEWHVMYADERCTLFARAGSVQEKALLAHMPPPPSVPDEARLSFP